MITFTKFPLEDTLGGAEFHTLKLAKHFKEQGHGVALFSSDKKLLKLFKDHGLPATYIWAGWEPTSKWSLLLWPLTYLIAKSRLKNMVSGLPEESTVFTQSLTEKLLLTPYCLRSTDYSLRPVWLEHKVPGRWLKLNPLKYKYLKLSRQVQVVTVSNFSREKFVELGVPESNIKVIYPGVKTPKASSPKHKASFTIGILSRLDPEKGVYDFLKLILPEARKNNWHILVAGEGEEFSKIKKLPVKTVGFVSDLDEFFAQISVFAYPTKAEESFGIAALESVARGVPVVANSKGALPEIIPHPFSRGEGPAGFLIEKPSDWIKHLKLLSENKELYQQISRNALERAKDFSEKQMLAEFDNLI